MPRQQDLLEIEFAVNNEFAAVPAIYQLGSMAARRSEQIMIAQYDFSKSGGAIGNINLLDPLTGKAAQLPNGGVIIYAFIDVLTAPSVGGGPTIAISSGQSAADLKAATASSSYAGLVAANPVNSAATSIKMTADRTMSIAIATAALTSGKFNVIVEYVLSI